MESGSRGGTVFFSPQKINSFRCRGRRSARIVAGTWGGLEGLVNSICIFCVDVKGARRGVCHR